MRRMKTGAVCIGVGGLLLGLFACTAASSVKNGANPADRTYTLSWPVLAKQVRLTGKELEDLGGREVASSYFDRAMSYKNSRFISLPFENILRHYPEGEADAVLLDCVDDYQGLLSLADVRRFGLELATRILLAPDSERPGWLHPLLILVPEGSPAPFQERYMTANIRELRFVNLRQYYRPLDDIADRFPESAPGVQAFKDNCVYCHSAGGIGGGKGGSLLKKFDFKLAGKRDQFVARFLAFHHKDNADKQNVEQFVDHQQLKAIAGFLEKVEKP